jgi:hypothetical protein
MLVTHVALIITTAMETVLYRLSAAWQFHGKVQVIEDIQWKLFRFLTNHIGLKVNRPSTFGCNRHY